MLNAGGDFIFAGMKKASPLLLFLLLFTCGYALDFDGPRLLSYKLLKTITQDELRKTMHDKKIPKSMVKANNDVEVYDISYKTCWHDGVCIKATGLYFVPKDRSKPFAEAVMHHGTRMNADRSQKLGAIEMLCTGMAADGYAVLLPDYVGLGGGDKFHLYLDANTEGHATVDMLFAVRELNDSLGVKLSGQLFLTGYSQGGHACMAATKMLQEQYANDFKVTASAPMAGPYDLQGVQSTVMFEKYTQPLYLPYMMRSFNEVYHIVPDVNDIYKAPYDSLLRNLFDGKHNLKQISAALPDTPYLMLKDTFVKMYLNDPDFPIRKALKDNSLTDWKPEMPMMLCYCDADEQVKASNAKVAAKSFREKGSKHIRLLDAGKKYGHTKCALFAFMYGKLYFDSFRNGSKYGRKGRVTPRFILALAKLAVKP